MTHNTCIVKKPDFHFCTDSMDLTSVNTMQLTPKAVILCEMTHNEGHKDVQGHRFWYKLTLTYNFLLVTNFISYFAQFPYRWNYHNWQGCPYLAPSFGVNLWTLDCNIQPQKLETALYNWRTTYFDIYISNRLGGDHWCHKQKDRRTELWQQ